MLIEGVIMTIVRAILPLLAALYSLAVPLTAKASSVSHSPSPLWGTLRPGNHAVGFRRVFLHDSSRPWRRTRPYGQSFSPDLVGRPVQINIWYPSIAGSGVPMHYGDYLTHSAPQGYEALGKEMSHRNQAVTESLKPDAVKAARALAMSADFSARPQAGRYPIVVLLGGLGAGIDDNVILAEYLASHGYVVASVSLLGETEDSIAQSRSRDGVEASVRDVEFAVPAICSSSNGDCGKVAVAGHSIGGVIAALYANRNPNVTAVIAFDGTYGFEGEGRSLTEATGYAPDRMRAALLDLRRAAGEQYAQLDLSPVKAYRHVDRTWVTLRHIHHSDFTSFAMVADRFGVPVKPDYAGTGWDRSTGRKGYESAARITLAFLSDTLAKPLGGGTATKTAARDAGATYAYDDAVPVPPSARETIALTAKSGMTTAKAAFTQACDGIDMHQCLDQDSFNSAGYAALSANDLRAAIALFELVAWAFPGSANAQDSLADGLIKAGRVADARTATRRAITLADTDPSLDAATRQMIIDTGTRRLSQLNRATP